MITRPDPVSAEEWQAWLDYDPADEPPDDEEDFLPPDAELTQEELAEIRDATDARAAANAARLGTTDALGAIAASFGRRGPGQPGSAHRFAGESSSRAALFATGLMLDVTPACLDLALLADQAAGDDDSYPGASDDELIGVLCAWDRMESHMAARKMAAIAELYRRRPEPDATVGPGRIPSGCGEFAADELSQVLAESRGRAYDMLTVAACLHAKLPRTCAALRDGTITLAKAWIIALAAELLTPEEAAELEKLLLGGAGRLTPSGLRSATARAVMRVAPDKARKRREAAAKDARVQRWIEDSGNAALMGRELPPDEVLAADQRITAWARELRQAGLDGDMDVLRARAYLDLLLGQDSRPRAQGGSVPGNDPSSPGSPGSGPQPAGFAGHVNLTAPLATMLDLADRPGEISGLGPVDPWLARDLARAAAANPRTTWCVTVTDADGHAIGHGCARSQPENHRKQGKRDGTGFSFTAASRDGPPGGYGTWRLRVPGDGPDLIVELDPITTQNCDHRYQAKGHDPGVKLRHLTQIRYATCTSPTCRRPASQCDFEHNVPYEAGGRTCLCNGGPKCRHDHRLKQDPHWQVEQHPDGTFTWTTPTGRQYTSEPTRYPV